MRMKSMNFGLFRIRYNDRHREEAKPTRRSSAIDELLCLQDNRYY